MPGKSGDFGSKAINALAAAAAAFLVRKAIGFAWTKTTGKQPPDTPEDPQVALGEAVAWAVMVGVGVGVARVLAVKLASRQTARQVSGSPDLDA
jgi:hypothetical protein